MTTSKDIPRKTKEQLKRSAFNSLLIALLVAVFPLFYILDYRKLGFIYTGKTKTVTSSGDEALLIIYGTIAAALFAALIAIYNAGNCLIKIKKGEFSAVDKSPEFVICKNCKTSQFAKDLVDGHCVRCTGEVEALEGYYERHPEQLNGKQK